MLEDQSKSEKVLRIARLYDRALEVFEDQQAAEKWLKEPARGLGEAILKLCPHGANCSGSRAATDPFRFDSRLVTSFNLIDLPDDWDILPPPDSTQTIGTEWAMKKKSEQSLLDYKSS